MNSAIVLETERMQVVPREMRDWISFRPDSALIGFCGLEPLVVEAKKEVEIGWWLARDCWGARPGDGGGTTRRDGFERAGLGRVIALGQPANLASIRAMKKLGMSYERDVIHKGILVVLYSISARRPAP